jgi:hypothetical protein
MVISDLAGHRTRIAIAILLAAAVGIGWATTWSRCQPLASGSSYLWVLLFGSLLGIVLYAAETMPVLLAGETRPAIGLAIGFALAAMMAFAAWNLMLGSGADSMCGGTQWGG